MTKRAIFVFGPESSGTRLMTRLLILAGCWGDADHSQRLDVSPPPDDVNLVVWRRSVPHAARWFSIDNLISHLEPHGFTRFQAVVTARDLHAMSHSQVAAGHVPSVQAARTNIQRAYTHIFSQLAKRSIPHILVTYEGLTTRPRETLRWLTSALDLTLPAVIPEIYNGNEKWLEKPFSPS